MRPSFRSLLIAALVGLSVGDLRAEDSAADLIAKGNVHYDQLEPAAALTFYLPAEKLTPNDADLLVRIARQYRHLMSETKRRDEKVRLGTLAVSYAKRAVALTPNDPEAHLSLAISYGKLLPFQTSKEQVNNSRLVKAAADKVLALDPRNDLGWQILGRWYFNLADVSGLRRALAQVVYGKLPPATYADAERSYLKAIQLNPNRLMHYIELGRTYIAMNRPTEARKFLAKGLAMPSTEKDDPDTKAIGRELLKKVR